MSWRHAEHIEAGTQAVYKLYRLYVIFIWRPLYSPLTFTQALHCILGQEQDAKMLLPASPHDPQIHRSPILMVWLSSVYLAATLPRSSCLRVGTPVPNTTNTPKLSATGPTIWSTMQNLSQQRLMLNLRAICVVLTFATTCVHNFWQNSHCWQKLQIKVQSKTSTVL